MANGKARQLPLWTVLNTVANGKTRQLPLRTVSNTAADDSVTVVYRFVTISRGKEGNVLFNDALNTFYLQ